MMKTFVQIGLLSVVLLAGFPGTSWTAQPDPLTRLKNSPKQHEIPDIVTAIIDQGPQTIPALIEFLKQTPAVRAAAGPQERQQREDEWQARVAVMELLREWKVEDALEPLEDILHSPDIYEQGVAPIVQAAYTIGKIGGEKSFQILQQTLFVTTKSDDMYAVDTKDAAIYGLGVCGDKRAIPLLYEELHNQQNNYESRVYAAGALGMLGETGGIEVVFDGLKSNVASVKRASIMALGLIGSSSALPLLRDIVQQDLAVYHILAQAAIIQIETQQRSPDEQVRYLSEQLPAHARNTVAVLWGTERLQALRTPASRAALKQFADDPAPEHAFLRSIAGKKLKFMPY